MFLYLIPINPTNTLQFYKNLKKLRILLPCLLNLKIKNAFVLNTNMFLFI